MYQDIEFSSKKQAISLLNEIFEKWTSQLSKMTAKKASSLSFHANRTLKDDVGHLFYWQKVSVTRLQAALDNKNPIVDFFPQELDLDSDSDLKAINEWIYKTNSENPWPDVYNSWKDNFTLLLSLADKFDEATLLAPAKFFWLHGYPLIAVLSGTYNHHAEHFEKLLKK